MYWDFMAHEAQNDLGSGPLQERVCQPLLPLSTRELGRKEHVSEGRKWAQIWTQRYPNRNICQEVGRKKRQTKKIRLGFLFGNLSQRWLLRAWNFSRKSTGKGEKKDRKFIEEVEEWTRDALRNVGGCTQVQCHGTREETASKKRSLVLQWWKKMRTLMGSPGLGTGM